MNNTRNSRAFTLVELLVVIAIIGILAALLLPVLKSAKIAAQKAKAKLEMGSLVTAIQSYDQDYSRFPVSAGAQAAAAAVGWDFTYGGIITAPDGSTKTVANPASWGAYSLVNNAEVIAILMDNTSGAGGVNAGHQKNPKQVKYLNATVVSDVTLPGVGPDFTYRDPWGNPYIITMDLNYDGQCDDVFYSDQSVSQQSGQAGYNGLFNSKDPAGASDNFYYQGKVMIWSAGPDGKIDKNIKANAGVNKDNVLSWQ